MRGVLGWLVVVAALACSGCGGDDAEPGKLLVSERWESHPGFIEGHLAYASLADSRGRVIERAQSNPLEPEEAFLTRRLEPGRYRVEGYVRSCAPACTPRFPGDPPSHRCGADVEIDGDTAVTFVRGQPDGCHVEIAQPPGSGGPPAP